MPDRFVDILSGVAMLVTDLHGEGDAFDRCVETFMALRSAGEADHLIFMGDLIHGYGKKEDDHSLRMILQVMDIQQEVGKDHILMLLGNHEMPHIYGVSLAKGHLQFTPRFEHAMGEHREKIVTFLKDLPFMIRTGAGVVLCHAGPDEPSINRMERLRRFDHDDLLRDADGILANQKDLNQLYQNYSKLSGQSYESLAKEFLAVSGPEDPRYPHLMRALMISERDHRFAMLWDFLFSQNNRGYSPEIYEQICTRYLDNAALDTGRSYRVCISGHIKVPHGGHQIVNGHHLRLATAAHATPRQAGEYLLLDCGKPIEKANSLVADLNNLF